jgi:hypothetical protein
MKKSPFLVLLAFSVFLSSCGDSPESVAEDTTELYSEVVEIFKEFTESGDKDAAIEDLKDLEGEAGDLASRLKQLIEDEFEGDRAALAKKMEEFYDEHEDAEKVMKSFLEEGMKLQASGKEGAKEVYDTFKNLLKDLD